MLEEKGVREEIIRGGRLRGTDFQLQNKHHGYKIHSVGNIFNKYAVCLGGDV